MVVVVVVVGAAIGGAMLLEMHGDGRRSSVGGFIEDCDPCERNEHLID